MNILVLDNPALVDELRVNHSVVTCGRWEDRYQIRVDDLHPSLPDVIGRCEREFAAPDVLFFIEGGVKHLWEDMDQAPQLTAYYAVDSHLHFSWQRNYARLFDVLFVAQKDYVRPFMDWGARNVHWLPLACTASRDRNLRHPRDIDVCFVGKLDPKIHPERAAFFEKLRSRLNGRANLVVTSGDYVELYNRARVILNESVNRDLNQRVFEAMACGGMLITEEMSNGLTDLFEPGRDLVTYGHGDVDRAADLIRYYLEHDAERESVAESGHRKVMEAHTTDHRAAEIENVLSALHRDSRKRTWEAREYYAMAKTYLMLAYPNSPVFAERVRKAAEHFQKAAGFGPIENVGPYLALLSILQSQPDAALDHLLKSLQDPSDRALACWILALLLSGQDSARSESYYQLGMRDLMMRPDRGAEEMECFQVASVVLRDKVRIQP